MRAVICLLVACQAPAAGFHYREAVPGYRFQFPRDHFGHPDFRTEWWYYTGNVHEADGHRYGFELVFFRRGQRDRQKSPGTENESAWRVDDLYLAHLALTDIDGKRHRYLTRLNRAGPGLAGVSLDRGRIWNGNWVSQWETSSGAQKLTVVAEGIRFELRLTPAKAPVINGENGISQKGDGAGQASYYISFPRLTVEGTLNGAAVAGTAWMDHEWFTNQLAPNQAGWDWFSIQLDNQTELMLFQLRRTDGTIDPNSAGTFIDTSGRARHLRRSDFRFEALEYWHSPKTGGRYPTRWRISVPSLNLILECKAALPSQELVSEDAEAPTYWEGAVTYTGAIVGTGYLEMTGYVKPMRL